MSPTSISRSRSIPSYRRLVAKRHKSNSARLQSLCLHQAFYSSSSRPRRENDRHKSDCICAVCQVRRRKKERDEILAVVDNETAGMDYSSDQHDMEVSMI